MLPELVEALMANGADETTEPLMAGQIGHYPAAPGTFHARHFVLLWVRTSRVAECEEMGSSASYVII
jgi:hypothetical protein